jgi:serine/threonine protein kinase
MMKGTRIAQYEIIEELGQGGFATVYRAHDTRMRREVALKLLAGDYTQQPELIQRFHQEAMIAANLRHPYIVPVYDFGEAEGSLYLVMALIGEGRTLRDRLAGQGALPLNQAWPILTQLGNALDYLHRQGLVHRDVKPANLLLEGDVDDPRTILADFGLVRSLEAGTNLTCTGAILGTPAYLSPEQADPERWGPITPLTDVYAVGVIAFEMLVGRPPFEGSLATVLHAHAYDPPPQPLELAPGLGEDLAHILSAGLVKPPAERYPAASALAAALRQVANQRRQQLAQQLELEQLLEQAHTAYQARDWLTAQHLCVEIMQMDRNHPDAITLMTEATRGLQEERAREVELQRLAQRYQAGQVALAAGDWQAAADAFGEVVKGQPDHQPASDGLAQALDQLQRAAWFDEAMAHAQAQNWREAVAVWLNVLDGHLDYRAGEAALHLLEAARGLLGCCDDLTQRLRQAEESVELHEAVINYWKRLYNG